MISDQNDELRASASEALGLTIAIADPDVATPLLKVPPMTAFRTPLIWDCFGVLQGELLAPISVADEWQTRYEYSC